MDRFQFAIAVLGCRTNQDEFDALRSVLLGMGGEEVGFPGPADLVLVNSCAVTASAQAKSRKEIRKAGRIKQGGFLIVTGCAAQADPAGLARLEGVDLVLGNRAKTNLPHILKRVLSGEGLAKERAESSRSGAALISWEADATVERFISRSGPIPARRSRPTLKIQDGCPFRCSFCIVPHLRGDPRSRDPGEVLREARRLAEAGMHEIVLTGINLGLYGAGFEQGYSTIPEGQLDGLLRELEKIESLQRIRLSSLEPMTITEGLLDAIADSSKVARHFHIAIQSGDDEILRRMGRPYDVSFIEMLVASIAKRMPLFGLGVDILVGFPGETEAAFSRTLQLLERLPTTYIHAFGYSERPGTPAESLNSAVPPALRKQRVQMVRELDRRLRLRFQRHLAGRRCFLVIERVEGERFEGLSGVYVRMEGQGRGLSRGEWVEVVAGLPGESGWQRCSLLKDGVPFQGQGMSHPGL